MTFSQIPSLVDSFIQALVSPLDIRTAARVPALVQGMLFASDRRHTVSSWIRAAGLSSDWRQTYATVCSCGVSFQEMASSALPLILTELQAQPLPPLAVQPESSVTAQPTVEVEPQVPPVPQPNTLPAPACRRLLASIDDSPTARYGPCVEGADLHRNPTPGPADAQRLYGHNWVTLSILQKHSLWGTIALPLQAQMYIRRRTIATLPPERTREFYTKLQLACGQLKWLKPYVEHDYEELWTVVDGGYSKRPFVVLAKQDGWTVIGRLRRDAALRDLPESKPRGRGRTPIYGKNAISLDELAKDPEGWVNLECVQYRQKKTKTIKTFQATYRPAGGLIRVVLVKEEKGWVAFFSTKADATPKEILETAADRGAVEETNSQVKEIWGAGEQQVRNLYSNEACFNFMLWMITMVELWAWQKPHDELVDRHLSPWDDSTRRPSHMDKCKALRLEILRDEFHACLPAGANTHEIRELFDQFLELLL